MLRAGALVALIVLASCSDQTEGAKNGVGGTNPSGGASGSAGGNPNGGNAAGGAVGTAGGGGWAGSGGGATGWPTANEYSWDGSWSPASGDFPLAGLLDDEYFDGHLVQGQPSPILPPGQWDWDDDNDDLANWRNFSDNLGSFEQLLDAQQRHFGWRLVGHESSVDYAGAAAYFEGSSGTDLMNLGADGAIHSFASGTLADGPDVLVFNRSWSLDFRTGSSLDGSARDNDLVIAGCDENPDGSFDVATSTIHTGPGRDWVFVRDIERAAIDLGNGAGGRTDTLDPADGDDLVVLRGNTLDFRVFGGAGDDVAVWYLDENVQTTLWLGPNFFGGGGWSDALWSDTGTDRLVLAIPVDTQLVTTTPTPPGGLLVKGTDGQFIEDTPTVNDPYAAYCIECGTSPNGRKTIIMEYSSADETVFTGYFYVTGFEQLQIGIGSQAIVYRLDDVAGSAELASDLLPYDPPSAPSSYCSL